MHICNVRSQVFFPGVWVCLRDFYFMFYFFGSLEREPSLWENTWPWEILRTLESFPGIPLGNQDLWGGEKESTFDTGRRVETGTYHWEGKNPSSRLLKDAVSHIFHQDLRSCHQNIFEWFGCWGVCRGYPWFFFVSFPLLYFSILFLFLCFLPPVPFPFSCSSFPFYFLSISFLARRRV